MSYKSTIERFFSLEITPLRFGHLLLVFALVYITAHLVGNHLHFAENNVAMAWPAGGVLLGILAITSPRKWGFILLLSSTIQIWSDIYIFDRSVIAGILFLTVNAGEAILGASLLRIFACGRPQLNRLGHTIAFISVTCLIASPLTAMFGTLGIQQIYGTEEFLSVFQVWWFADSSGALIVAPIILLSWPPSESEIDAMTWKETSVYILVTISLSSLVFSQGSNSTNPILYPYILFPVAFWGALRGGPSSATLASLVISSVALWNVAQGHGPFVQGDQPHHIVLRLQTYIASLCITNLILAAIRSEKLNAIFQQRVLEKLLAKSQRLEAVGQLAGGIAHDFNNLLTHILMSSELAKQNESTQKNGNSELLLEISQSALRAAALTRQLLLFGRRQPMDHSLIDIHQVLNNLQPMLRRLVPEDIDLRFCLDSQQPSIFGDVIRIEQVVLNLVVNSRDAMPQGGKIEVTTRKFLQEESSGIEICVSDSGIGIRPENIERVFDPFYTTKPEGQGTGLGLATVKTIVQELKGSIQIESALSQGTCIRIRLPTEEHSINSNILTLDLKIPSNGHGTILICEDDDSIRRLICSTLNQAGYQVLTARSGDEAISVLQTSAHSFDAILTDVVMPGKNGAQVAVTARKLHPSILIIYMSGYSAGVIENKTTLRGESILHKPFTPDQLLHRLSTSLDSCARASSEGTFGFSRSKTDAIVTRP